MLSFIPIRKNGADKHPTDYVFFVAGENDQVIYFKPDNIELIAIEVIKSLKEKGITYAEAVIILGRAQEILNINIANRLI